VELFFTADGFMADIRSGLVMCWGNYWLTGTPVTKKFVLEFLFLKLD
jgi:hypothetical protein